MDTTSDEASESRLIRFKELQTLIPVAKATLYGWMDPDSPYGKDKNFPARVRIGSAVFWRLDEVLRWRASHETATHDRRAPTAAIAVAAKTNSGAALAKPSTGLAHTGIDAHELHTTATPVAAKKKPRASSAKLSGSPPDEAGRGDADIAPSAVAPTSANTTQCEELKARERPVVLLTTELSPGRWGSIKIQVPKKRPSVNGSIADFEARIAALAAKVAK